MKKTIYGNSAANPGLRLCIAGLLLLSGLSAGSEMGACTGQWRPLFNGQNLDGWYTFLQNTGRNNDPNQVFQIHDGMIHVYKDAAAGSTMPFGYIATQQEYENYDIRLEYRWGQKKFAPREKALRDSGLLYHIVGPDGAFGGVWPRSVECQIQEGDTGDIYAVKTRLTTTVHTGTKNYCPADANGVAITIDEGIIKHSRNSRETDGWNNVEVQVRGNRAIHIVNGTVNAAVTDIMQPDPADPKQFIPLTKGRILLQAEGAEIFYRNVEIREMAPESAAAASLPRDGQGINEQVMSQLGWKIAVQCWTYNKLTLFESLDNIQKLGIHYVELLSSQTIAKDIPAQSGPDMDTATLARVKAKLAQTGIQAVAVWVDPLPKEEAKLRKLFAWAKELGIETITTEPDPKDPAALALTARLCQEFGIKIAVHNHAKPTAYWNPEFALSVVKDYHPWIGLCPDTGHWYRSGLTPLDNLKKVEGHIFAVHLKDLDKDKHDMPLGDGVNDAAGQMAELKRQGFRGIITIEHERWDDRQHSDLLRYVDFLNKTAARLAAVQDKP